MFAACKAIASRDPRPACSGFGDAVAFIGGVRGGRCGGGSGNCGGGGGGGSSCCIAFVENTTVTTVNRIRVTLC